MISSRARGTFAAVIQSPYAEIRFDVYSMHLLLVPGRIHPAGIFPYGFLLSRSVPDATLWQEIGGKAYLLQTARIGDSRQSPLDGVQNHPRHL